MWGVKHYCTFYINDRADIDLERCYPLTEDIFETEENILKFIEYMNTPEGQLSEEEFNFKEKYLDILQKKGKFEEYINNIEYHGYDDAYEIRCE